MRPKDEEGIPGNRSNIGQSSEVRTEVVQCGLGVGVGEGGGGVNGSQLLKGLEV